MNLLSLLQELEPNAGWQMREGIVHAFTVREDEQMDVAWFTESDGYWTAIVQDNGPSDRWVRVTCEHEDQRIALIMALAGYRVGETR